MRDLRLLTGTRLGPYVIREPLGQGGMGEVYRATDTKLGREVAIKVLPASISQHPESLVRFEREARALAALNHPHIAAIYGFDTEDGTDFLVLELVEGDTLAERLKHGRLPVEEALRVARQIAEAVDSAHAKGIIHRDLNPGNIKITPDEELDPLAFIIIDRSAEIQRHACRYTEALANSKRAARLRPDPFLPNFGEQTTLLSLTGKQAEAVEFARAIRKNSSPRTRWNADAQAVWTLQKAGLTQEAGGYADELAARPLGAGYSRGYVLIALGRFEEALPFLAQIPPIAIRTLYWDTMLDPHRDDPRFQELLVKLQCVEEYKVARQTLTRMLKEQQAKQ